MNRLTVNDFIQEFASRGYTLKDSRIILEDFKETINDILCRGDALRIHGFLDFDLVWRDSRMVNNPSAGKLVQAPARYSLKVHPGYYLKKNLEAASVERRERDAEE